MYLIFFSKYYLCVSANFKVIDFEVYIIQNTMLEDIEKSMKKELANAEKSETKKFKVLLEVNCTQEDQETIKKRIFKFFRYGNREINIENQFLEKRKQPHQGTKIVPNILVIYGSQFLGKKELETRFYQRYNCHIKRWGPSHCKLIFSKPTDAQALIYQQLRFPSEWKDIQNSKETSIEWFQLKTYNIKSKSSIISKVQRRLFCRYATNEEFSVEDEILIQQAQIIFQEKQKNEQRIRSKFIDPKIVEKKSNQKNQRAETLKKREVERSRSRSRVKQKKVKAQIDSEFQSSFELKNPIRYDSLFNEDSLEILDILNQNLQNCVLDEVKKSHPEQDLSLVGQKDKTFSYREYMKQIQQKEIKKKKNETIEVIDLGE